MNEEASNPTWQSSKHVIKIKKADVPQSQRAGDWIGCLLDEHHSPWHTEPWRVCHLCRTVIVHPNTLTFDCRLSKAESQNHYSSLPSAIKRLLITMKASITQMVLLKLHKHACCSPPPRIDIFFWNNRRSRVLPVNHSYSLPAGPVLNHRDPDSDMNMKRSLKWRSALGQSFFISIMFFGFISFIKHNFSLRGKASCLCFREVTVTRPSFNVMFSLPPA